MRLEQQCLGITRFLKNEYNIWYIVMFFFTESEINEICTQGVTAGFWTLGASGGGSLGPQTGPVARDITGTGGDMCVDIRRLRMSPHVPTSIPGPQGSLWAPREAPRAQKPAVTPWAMVGRCTSRKLP